MRSRATRRGESEAPAETTSEPQENQGSAMRETVESIVVAVILAFLFRAFIAEAFVIPTGSMAPTLQGRHKDVECSQCAYQYRTGASIENEVPEVSPDGTVRTVASDSAVIGTTCPVCRYQMTMELYDKMNHASFNGDRILVSKFTYDLSNPQRWDVIVFKFPENAKQNYIKRLIGLPNESIWILHGDVYVKKKSDREWMIARKPERKLRAMLQLVHDTAHRADRLVEAGWPARWQPLEAGSSQSDWATEDNGRTFEIDGAAGESWLRYQHIVPSEADWERVERGEELDTTRLSPQLITDFYAYNAFLSVPARSAVESLYDAGQRPRDFPGSIYGSRNLRDHGYRPLGLHWVGDLALEAKVEITSEKGVLALDLVEAGTHFTCRIDVSNGKAELTMDNDQLRFDGDQKLSPRKRTAETRVKGSGKYRLRLSNVDDEVRLWVNNKVIKFDGPTSYNPPRNLRPAWRPGDPGDLAPAGIGSRSLSMKVENLRILRDVYYVASHGGNVPHEYNDLHDPIHGIVAGFHEDDILNIMRDPTTWETTPLFDQRRDDIQFHMGDDQFFPMGDNSPQSADARMWPDPFVPRELMIGKALLIYWPHAWNKVIPNFGRMRLIR